MKIQVSSSLQMPSMAFAALDTTVPADILRLLSLTNQQKVERCSDHGYTFQITYESGLVLFLESEGQ